MRLRAVYGRASGEIVWLDGAMSRTGDPYSAPRSSMPPGIEPGGVVSGKFRIDRVLGEGGMGVVVLATHLQLDEPVALKFLRAEAVAESEALTRFLREAQAASKLKSEHVARVLDVAVTDEGLPYIVMEYLQGNDLSRTVQSSGPLTVEDTAEYVIQACEGLAEAHARGFVHRDIKLENLFLADQGEGWRTLKILDFGISKIAAPAGMSNFSTRSIMGSPCYMSPEELRSTAGVDHRTDIWALGVTIFELLAGKTPYDGGRTLPELVTAILEGPPPSIVEARPGIPRTRRDHQPLPREGPRAPLRERRRSCRGPAALRAEAIAHVGRARADAREGAGIERPGAPRRDELRQDRPASRGSRALAGRARPQRSAVDPDDARRVGIGPAREAVVERDSVGESFRAGDAESTVDLGGAEGPGDRARAVEGPGVGRRRGGGGRRGAAWVVAGDEGEGDRGEWAAGGRARGGRDRDLDHDADPGSNGDPDLDRDRDRGPDLDPDRDPDSFGGPVSFRYLGDSSSGTGTTAAPGAVTVFQPAAEPRPRYPHAAVRSGASRALT